jgi:hypothetical protein
MNAAISASMVRRCAPIAPGIAVACAVFSPEAMAVQLAARSPDCPLA